VELRLLLWLGAEPGTATVWFALILTYLTHSIVSATAIAVLVRAGAVSSATRHLYWKMALIGPLLTASLAVAVEDGHSHLRGVAYVRDVTVPSFEMFSASSITFGANALARVSAVEPRSGAASWVQSPVVLDLGMCAAMLGLIRFVGSALLLAHRLRSRARVTEPELLRRLDRLRSRMGLRGVLLSESSEVRSPLVLGRREICLPCPLPPALSDAELDTVLAHELAHVERADGVWFLIAGAVQSALWLNPLNHFLATYFRDSAELACDDRAVEVTRDPLGLARALVQVATSAWPKPGFAGVPTMGRSKSAILPRVRRLTCRSATEAERTHGCGRIQAIAALTLLACLLGMLSVQIARANPKPSPAIRKAPSLHVRTAALASAPDPSEQSARMAELAIREQRILAELEAAQRGAAATLEGSPASVRVLELSQELRHVRANQAWLEERFVADWEAWQKAAPSRRAAP
jgi:beta-lactamase regulating signal transducer with metallopeptidase domain